MCDFDEDQQKLSHFELNRLFGCQDYVNFVKTKLERKKN